MLAALSVNGIPMCVLIDRSMRARQVSINLGRRAYEGTILEGELYENKLLLYDGLIIDGCPVVISGSSTDTTRSRFVKTCIPMRSDA